MVSIRADIVKAYTQSYNNEVHDPTTTYPAFRHVKDGNGIIYVALREVAGDPDPVNQIPLTDTTHWQKATEASTGSIDIDAVIEGTTPDGNLVSYRANNGQFETFAVDGGSEYVINTAGFADSRQAVRVEGDHVGFGGFPNNSNFNRLSYCGHVALTNNDLQQSNIRNAKLDMCIDTQGFLVTAYGQPIMTRMLLENSSYARVSFSNDFESCLENRRATVTKLSSFQGTYIILLSNGNFYTKKGGDRETIQQMYGDDWMARSDFDTREFIGLDRILDFEHANNLFLILWINTSSQYQLSVVRMDAVGGAFAYTVIKETAIGTDRPTRFGFVSYPAKFDASNDPPIFHQTGTIRTTIYEPASVGSGTIVLASAELYPFLEDRYYVRQTPTATGLSLVVNDVVDTTTLSVVPPDAHTSFVDGAEHGLCFMYPNAIYVEGSNNFGELGTGDTTATAGTTVTILPTNPPARMRFKNCMFGILGETRCLILWSDSEVWMCGLGGVDRARIGRFMGLGNHNVGDSDYLTSSNTFVKIFSTGNTIMDVYVHNNSSSITLNPMIAVLLDNGLVYAKGNNLTDGDGYSTNDKRASPNTGLVSRYGTENGGSFRELDPFNINWRRLSI